MEKAARLADWELVALNGRTVYIAFDSDVTTKPAVGDALVQLKAFLESRKATVEVVSSRPGRVARRRAWMTISPPGTP